jgi:hypothetical protein
MNDTGLLRPALIGGVLLGILSVIPGIHLVNCFCCAWVIGGGILAAHFYVKSSPVPVTLGRGVALGLLTGAVGAVVDTLFSIPLHVLMARVGANVAEQARKTLESIPEMPAEARDLLSRIFSDAGSTSLLLVTVAFFFKLVVYPVMAMLGGAVGVALFEKRTTGGAPPAAPYVPPPVVPPPPPPPPIPPPSIPPAAE